MNQRNALTLAGITFVVIGLCILRLETRSLPIATIIRDAANAPDHTLRKGSVELTVTDAGTTALGLQWVFYDGETPFARFCGTWEKNESEEVRLWIVEIWDGNRWTSLTALQVSPELEHHGLILFQRGMSGALIPEGEFFRYRKQLEQEIKTNNPSRDTTKT